AVFLAKLAWRDKGRDFSECFDIDSSLSHRMRAALPTVATLGELFTALKAKNLTDAHIRRAVLNAYFGVTPEEIHTPPSYTRLLAMNERGRTCFKRIRAHSTLPILVRPTDKSHLKDETVKAAVECADFADALYLQSLPTPQSAANLYKKAPLVMK
ncbi:MAG: nucleotidyltransferase family protein, partial [Eubacteriales bacterium]